MDKIEEQKRNLYSIRMNNLRAIGELYPHVKRVTVKYRSKSESWEGNEEEGQVSISEGLLDFLIKCPNDTCTGIGFDLNNEVREAVRRNVSHTSGEKKCDGYEDEKRWRRYKCGSKIFYEIIIEYRKNIP